MACREVRSSRVTETAAFALTASKSTSVGVVRKRLSPQCSCTSALPALRAASMSVTAANGSSSSSIVGGHILRLGPARRNAHGDGLADVAHLARGQHRLHGGLEARQCGVGADWRNADQVIGDEDAIAHGQRDLRSP